MYAAKTGDVARLRWLLARDARPDLADSDGRTALYWAAKEGHAEAARLLLTRGAAVDAPTAYGARPLYIASFHGHAAIVRELLARGAAVDAEFDGGTPLLFAARGGHAEVVVELLQHGAAVDAAGTGETALYAASRVVACARPYRTKLVSKAERLSQPSTEEEWQRWHQRCAGHREVVRELLARGAAVEFADEEEGFRPLHQACKAGCVELVKVLLEGGAAVNALSGNDYSPASPLCVASEDGHEAVVNALLAAGATAETAVLLRTRAQARARAR
jgi:ankyrin repeat protein